MLIWVPSRPDRCNLVADIPGRDYTSGIPCRGGVDTGVNARLLQVNVLKQHYNVGTEHLDGCKINDNIQDDMYTSYAPCRSTGTGVEVSA